MKKPLLAITVLILFSGPVLAQLAQIDTNTVIYSWKLDESLANRIRTDVDTNLADFQRYNPVFRNYTGVETLGNFGLPARSIVYSERPDQEFLLIENYSPFMKFFQNTQYFNTKKPFTQLTYIKGGSNQTKEELFNAFHSQNLTKTLNIGVNFTSIGSLGQYSFQKVKNNSFRFFSSYSGRYYAYHVSVNYNKIMADENGGVLNDSLITDTTILRTKEIPTLFSGSESSLSHRPDVMNSIRNLNILAVQELAFRMAPKKNTDSTQTKPKKKTILYPKLVYIFNLNRSMRNFTDKDPMVGYNAGLYPYTYTDTATSDSLIYWKVSNSIRLQFQGRRNNHYFIDYSYELMKYSLWTGLRESDSTLHFINQVYQIPGLSYSSNLYNSYVSSGFSKLFANRFDVNLYGRYYLTGYKSGDINLAGDMKLIFGKLEKPFTFYARGTIESKSPDFLYSHYASNNFIWTRNFKRTTTNHLSTNLSLSSKKFALQADYYLLSNAIYLDEDAFPAQYRNALSLFVLSASKQVDFWKFTSIGKLVYQKTENENIIDLPELTFFNSTYLTHLFNFKATGGKLLIMLGFDMDYNTKYYADAYMPALSSFYNQHEKQLGNYPYFDAFLNVDLKRFRFFVKVEHLNAGWIDQNYFSILHYPRNGRDLKFGLSWTFYD
ncbi:MAG TPA: putative porin [Bacteroidales bacterium]|nr:putative porin [Bacteroidales bacterium]